MLNADSGKPVGVIADTSGVHGIAIASAANRGFTSNGTENTVTMFGAESLRVIAEIPVGTGPGGIYFDGLSNRVFTDNHGSHDISVIDAASGKVVGTVRIEGAGEQAASDGDGLTFVNLEDKSEVAAFDPKTLEVKKRFPIGAAKRPPVSP